jgi:hypothetical protein
MSNHGDEKDRRRYLRIAADEGLDCALEGSGVVHIVGISSEGRGMRVITDRELSTGVELDCRLTRDGKDLFTGKAKAVWAESWDFEFCSRHVAGIELLGLNDAERAVLVGSLPVMKEPGQVPEEML